jgi:adenine deaminase
MPRRGGGESDLTPGARVMSRERLAGQIVDVLARRVFSGAVIVEHGRIARIESDPSAPERFLLPGFVDAHVHIESSMLPPSEFARIAVRFGTVATVSDPHEIANVLGIEGVRWMMENGRTVPFKFNFGAPSCVPATSFETAGARLDLPEVVALLAEPEIRYLSEMMNWPGVLAGDAEVMAKIAAARAAGKPVDGHAPGLVGEEAARYVAAGIGTDHECFTYDEALGKLDLGMRILIREGSAARNFEALWPLMVEHPGRCMLCSDDKHPDELVAGYLDRLVARAIANGVPLWSALGAACVNPVRHYRLPVGLLRAGDPADLIEVDDLAGFRVRRTWLDGRLVAEDGETRFETAPAGIVNRFHCPPKRADDFAVPAAPGRLRAIEVVDGQIVTGETRVEARIEDGRAVADPERDLLKIAVVNRYADAPPAVAFVSGFGLRSGALASTVAHDSHNLIAVASDDEALARAVNALIEARGGLCFADDSGAHVLPLPIAGLMSPEHGEEVAARYSELDRRAREAGVTLRAPFMTLSFLALLVIPRLKLSDLGLFDGRSFRFVDRFTGAES